MYSTKWHTKGTAISKGKFMKCLIEDIYKKDTKGAAISNEVFNRKKAFIGLRTCDIEPS